MYDYDLEVPIQFTFYGGPEHKATIFFFSMKYESARIHFLGDVFLAVAVLVA